MNKQILNRLALKVLAVFVAFICNQTAFSQCVITMDGAVNIDVPSGTFFGVTGDVVITDATTSGSVTAFDNKGTVHITGNWTNNGAANSGFVTTGGAPPTTGTCILEGPAQSILGTRATTFFNLTLAGSGVKTLSVATATVRGALALADREFATGANILIVDAAGTITRTTGYVSSTAGGFLQRNTNTTALHEFPVSNPGGTRFRVMEITPANTTSNQYRVRLVNNSPTTDGFAATSTDANLCNPLSATFYWRVQQTAAQTATMTMYYASATDGAQAKMAHWEGAPVWTDMAASAPTTGTFYGTLTDRISKTGWSNFSPNEPFALANPPVPAAPTSPAAASITCSSFTASWTAPATALGYKIDVANNVSFSPILVSYNQLNVNNVTSYSVTSLTPGTQYWFRVRAYNTCGDGALSSVVGPITMQTTVAGTVASNAAYCLNSTSQVALNLSGQTGSVLNWEYDDNTAFSSPANLFNAGATTLPASSVVTATAGTFYYRAVVLNSAGGCPTIGSAYSTIQVGYLSTSIPTTAAYAPGGTITYPATNHRALALGAPYQDIGIVRGGTNLTLTRTGGWPLCTNWGLPRTLTGILNGTGGPCVGNAAIWTLDFSNTNLTNLNLGRLCYTGTAPFTIVTGAPGNAAASVNLNCRIRFRIYKNDGTTAKSILNLNPPGGTTLPYLVRVNEDVKIYAIIEAQAPANGFYYSYTHTASVVSGSPTMTLASNNDNIRIGMTITGGTGIPANTTIIDRIGTTITMSANANATSSAVRTFNFDNNSWGGALDLFDNMYKSPTTSLNSCFDFNKFVSIGNLGTISAGATPNPYCTFSSVSPPISAQTVTLIGNTGNVVLDCGVTHEWFTSATTSNGTTAYTGITVPGLSPPNNTTYYYSLVNAATSVCFGTDDITITTNSGNPTTWTGTATTGPNQTGNDNWYNHGNWDRCVPTITVDAVVDDNPLNRPIINTPGARAKSVVINGANPNKITMTAAAIAAATLVNPVLKLISP